MKLKSDLPFTDYQMQLLLTYTSLSVYLVKRALDTIYDTEDQIIGSSNSNTVLHN